MPLTDNQIAALGRAKENTRKAKSWYDTMRTIREWEIRRIAAEGGTYRDIAEAAGVTYQRVAQIVTGKEPPAQDFREIRDDFACPKCGAEKGEPCRGTSAWAHAERHDVAITAFREKHPELG